MIYEMSVRLKMCILPSNSWDSDEDSFHTTLDKVETIERDF